jgi:signal transduction histidine kinase
MSEKAYLIRKEIGDKRGIISSLIEFGLLHETAGATKEALEMFKQADELAQKINDKVSIAELAMAMAEIQIEEKQFAQALENVKHVLETISETSNQKLFIRAYIVMSKIHIQNKKYAEATALIDKVLTESRSSGNLIYELEALELGATCFQYLGRTDRAQHYRNDYALLNEKIKNTDLMREIDRLQFQLLIEKVETENKTLRVTKANNESLISRQRFQNVLLVITVIFSVILAVVFYAYSRKGRTVNLKLSQQNEKISSQQVAISETNAKLLARNQELNDLNDEKDSLMNIVAHDLKAPLNRITGLATLVEMEGGLSDHQREYLDMIKAVTKSGSDLITDLLDVNYLNESPQRQAIELVDIQAFLENRIKYFQVSADLKAIKIIFQPLLSGEFNSNPEYIIRIVDNLLSNAIKFSGKNTSIIVTCSVASAMATISIKDSGPGFTEVDKQFLFQRFKKLSARPTGGESSNGLGLAIVKTLVDRLDGDIKLNTNPGCGAEFIVTIPSIQ